jgi:selenocysteine lyase/cysteine desulfurase
VAAGYKRLMGPYSFGYLWAAEQHREGVGIEQTWIGRKGSDDFNRLIDYTDELREGARRYDVGEWSNFTLLPMAAAAIDLVSGLGADPSGGGAGSADGRVEEGTRRPAWNRSPAASRHSHLIGVRFQGEPPNLAPSARCARVLVSPPRQCAVSPHLYNDADDVDRLLEVLGGEVK